MEKFIRSVASLIDRTKIKPLYGTHLCMSVRFFNIIVTLLIIFPLISALFIFIFSLSYLLPTMLVSVSLLYLVVCVVANKTKKYRTCMGVVIYTFSFVMVPLIFFFGGGLKYGVWLYFIMGFFLSVLFLKHKFLIFTLMLQCLYYSCLFYIEYSYPNFIRNLYSLFKFNIFSIPERYVLITNLLIVAFCSGIFIKTIFVSYIDIHKTELKLVDQLQQQAIIDPLTGIYNRRHLYDCLEEDINQAQKNNMPFCIIMYDVDKFKDLNDKYGHLIGDEVLRGVSQLLTASLREYDIVARYGGEEFIVILPGAKKENALKRAEQIRESIQNTKILEELEKAVTVSGGVSCYKDGMSASKLIKIADNNLYKAKETGRNKIVCECCASTNF